MKNLSWVILASHTSVTSVAFKTNVDTVMNLLDHQTIKGFPFPFRPWVTSGSLEPAKPKLAR